MVWVGLGLIVFVVMLWVWRHTYTCRARVYEWERKGYLWDNTPYHYEYRDEDRLPMPRWAFMLLFVGCVVPIVNLVCLFLGTYFYTTLLIDEDLYFHLKGNKFTKAMAEFFTKDVYAKKKSE